jgi:hypothetical protein
MPKGGAREGAGRPKGRKNNDTIAREKATQAAIEKITSDLTQDEIDKMSPVELMLHVMREMIKSGDLRTAVSVAEKVAPYTNAKKSSELPTAPGLPPELTPDTGLDSGGMDLSRPFRRGPFGDLPAAPDEPGPAGGVIG